MVFKSRTAYVIRAKMNRCLIDTIKLAQKECGMALVTTLVSYFDAKGKSLFLDYAVSRLPPEILRQLLSRYVVGERSKFPAEEGRKEDACYWEYAEEVINQMSEKTLIRVIKKCISFFQMYKKRDSGLYSPKIYQKHQASYDLIISRLRAGVEEYYLHKVMSKRKMYEPSIVSLIKEYTREA